MGAAERKNRSGWSGLLEGLVWTDHFTVSSFLSHVAPGCRFRNVRKEEGVSRGAPSSLKTAPGWDSPSTSCDSTSTFLPEVSIHSRFEVIRGVQPPKRRPHRSHPPHTEPVPWTLCEASESPLSHRPAPQAVRPGLPGEVRDQHGETLTGQHLALAHRCSDEVISSLATGGQDGDLSFFDAI